MTHNPLALVSSAPAYKYRAALNETVRKAISDARQQEHNQVADSLSKWRMSDDFFKTETPRSLHSIAPVDEAARSEFETIVARALAQARSPAPVEYQR